jgi:hypothetical protein
MTSSAQGQGPETPVARPGATTIQPGSAGPAATGGTPLTLTPPQPSSLGASASGSGASGEQAAERAKADAETAATHAQAAADDATAGVRRRTDELKQQAEGVLDDARHRAREVAGEQKNVAAERLTGFASALRHASSDLDEQGQSVVSGFVRQAADGLEHFSGAVRRNDVDDLVGGIEDFARRQPAVFIGSAVLAGFGIARFMKSSSERRRGRGSAQQRTGFDAGPDYGAGPGRTYEGGV